MDQALYTIGGCVFTIGTIVAIMVGRIRGAQPKRQWTWESPPSLRISNEVPPAVRTACMSAWQELVRRLDAPVGIATVGGAPLARDGEIVVATLNTWAFPDHAGRCTTAVDMHTGKPTRATVSLPPGATSIVALHEILHALGFRHVQVSGHVLSGTTQRLGRSVDGIREAFQKGK